MEKAITLPSCTICLTIIILLLYPRAHVDVNVLLVWSQHMQNASKDLKMEADPIDDRDAHPRALLGYDNRSLVLVTDFCWNNAARCARRCMGQGCAA